MWNVDLEVLSLTGSTEPAYVDYSPPGWWSDSIRSGGLWWPFLYETLGSDQASVTVSHFADDFLQGGSRSQVRYPD